eukprot:1110186-Pyramimonas_sp.AAC.1
MPSKPPVKRASSADRQTLALSRNRNGIEMNMKTSESAHRADLIRGANGRHGQPCTNSLPQLNMGLCSGRQDSQ